MEGSPYLDEAKVYTFQERAHNPNFDNDLESRINSITASIVGNSSQTAKKVTETGARKSRKRKGCKIRKDEIQQPIHLPRKLIEYFRIKRLVDDGKGAIGEFVSEEISKHFPRDKNHHLILERFHKHFPYIFKGLEPHEDLSNELIRRNILRELVQNGCSESQLLSLDTSELCLLLLRIEEKTTFLERHRVPLPREMYSIKGFQDSVEGVLERLEKLVQDTESEVERLECYFQKEKLDIPPGELSLPELKQFYHEYKGIVG